MLPATFSDLIRKVLFSSLLLCVSCLSVQAHHSRANFDIDETIRLNGTVTNVRWRSPHVYWQLSVVNEQGETEDWAIEGHSIPGLMGNGWQQDSVKTGDHVLVVANPSRDPESRFILLDYFQHDDGRVFYSFRPPEGVESRGRDNDLGVAPSTDFSGTWTRLADGTPEENLRRALIGGFGAPTGLSLTVTGEAQVANYDANDDPYLNCEPLPLPRIITWPYSLRWTRANDHMLIEKELAQQVRRVYFDRETPPSDYVPDELGFSKGRMSGDGTLVIETGNFAPTRWGIVNGLDSSEQKSLLEEYRLSADGLIMSWRFTLTDPVYLTEPLVTEGRYRKIADHEFTNVPCDVQTSRQHLEFE